MDNAKLPVKYWMYYRGMRGDRASRLRATEDYFPAYQKLQDLLSDNPMEVIRLLIPLANEANGEEELSYLGAGPVEDLLVHASQEQFSLIEAKIRASPELLAAAHSVWVECSKLPYSLYSLIFGSRWIYSLVL